MRQREDRLVERRLERLRQQTALRHRVAPREEVRRLEVVLEGSGSGCGADMERTGGGADMERTGGGANMERTGGGRGRGAGTQLGWGRIGSGQGAERAAGS